ncbi:MAG: BlaI/MecI/CopY family transcriptional regulator [Clostridia bacterium]
MQKLSENEWLIMNALWKAENFSLGEVFEEVNKSITWSKNTVHTYLTRMQAKGLVKIEKRSKKPYSANVSKQECADVECDALLHNVYAGQTSELLTAFLKKSSITKQERDELLKLLDDMQVN